MKKIAAIIVTYNRKKLLLECIAHLSAQTMKQKMDIIVVDNASTDGTREALDAPIKKCEILYQNTGANLGGAGGFQYGIRYAVEQGYEFLWIMDDDSMPEKEALEELLLADKRLDGNYGFLSSRVLWKDGSLCLMNLQKTSISRKVDDFQSEQVPIISATFVSMFLRTEMVRKVGLPIGDFFIWCDDLEYTRRISREYPCFLIPSSIVVHKIQNNLGSNIAEDVPERLERYWYAYRNEIYFFRREGLKGWIYAVVRLFIHVMRVLFKAKDNKRKRLAVIRNGTLQGLHFRPDIEYVQK